MDCWAKTGRIGAPTARSARTCPGVASPSRSPKPTEVCRPAREGVSQGRAARSAAAFSAVVGATSRVPSAVVSRVPENARSALSSGATATSSFAPSGDRSSRKLAPPWETSDSG